MHVPVPEVKQEQKDIKCVPFSSTLALSYLEYLLLFSITRWKICPGCHYVGGAGGLVSGMCPTHGSSALSQLSKPLCSSSYDGIQDLQGLISWTGCYRTPVVLGGYFFPFKGLHIYIWQFLLWPEIALLRPKVSNPDNYTVTTQQGDVQLEGSAWSLLKPNTLGCCFPQSRCTVSSYRPLSLRLETSWEMLHPWKARSSFPTPNLAEKESLS